MRLNEKVIKPAINEINRVSDFRVTVDYHRQGRKVVALQFKIRRIILLPTPNHGQGKLFPDIEDMPIIVKELKEAGIVARDAWEIYQQGFGYVQESERPTHLGENEEAAFVEYVREKIHLLKRRLASGKVENSTGFLLQAIKHNYANPEFVEAQKRQVIEEQKKMRQQRQPEIKEVKRQLDELKNTRDDAIRERCKTLVEESPELLASVVEGLLAENTTFQKTYKMALTPVENYHNTMGVWSFMEFGLEKHYPERFADIYAVHDADLAVLKERLASLEQA
jgi:hypothetical protein